VEQSGYVWVNCQMFFYSPKLKAFLLVLVHYV
jgi:hypothetical protein